MRFKLVGNETSHTVKSGLFGIFSKTETTHKFRVLPNDQAIDFVQNTKNAYAAAFGSFDLFRVAKGFAADTDSRFSVAGFFLSKSGENFDNAVFVKVNNISEISSLWDELVSKEMSPDYRMMRSVIVKDKISGERIVLEGFFDLNIDFKDSADSSVIEDFNDEFLNIMAIATVDDDFGKELDRLFVKALEKSRTEKIQYS